MNKVVICLLLVLMLQTEAVQVQTNDSWGTVTFKGITSASSPLTEKPVSLLETQARDSTNVLETETGIRSKLQRRCQLDK